MKKPKKTPAHTRRHAVRQNQQRKAARRRAWPPVIAADKVIHPLAIYRPGRVAEIFDIDEATVWRWWAKLKILPPPIEFSPGIHGWTHTQISKLIAKRPPLTSEAAE